MKIVAKLVLCGDSAVGKTSLRRQFISGKFNPTYLMTIGADFAVKKLEYDSNDTVKLSIWDLAGQQNFSQIRSIYYKGATAMFLIFDLTRENTLFNLSNWISEIRKHINLSKVAFNLIGNKSDLRTPNHISDEEVREFLAKLTTDFGLEQVHYIIASAKTGENVENAFREIGEKLIEFHKS